MKYICKMCGVTWTVPDQGPEQTGSFMTVCPECANRPGQPNQEKLAMWTAQLIDIIDECEKDPALLEYLRPIFERMATVIERRMNEQRKLAHNSGG